MASRVGRQVAPSFKEGAMRKHLWGWLLGAIWIALDVALAAAYGTGAVTGSTFIFLGLCLLALGAIGFSFGSQMSEPDETVEQILYDTEHAADRKRVA
jgi:hypothetical protein